MEFQTLLLQVGQALSGNDVQALVFLCTDLLSQDLSSVGSAEVLFSILADQDLLTAERPHLLSELLSAIQRPRLVRLLGLSGPVSRTIPPYRKLLYDLSEDITEKEMKQIKFLLREVLPRKKMEDNVTILDLFLEMEHKDLLSSTNLNHLENIMENACPMWKKKINTFKAQNGFNERSNSDRRLLPPAYFSHPLAQGVRTYPMTRSPIGICLIINNYDFTKSPKRLKNREGTQIDERSLESVFKWLGFETQIENDCTRDRMLTVVQELRRRDHSQMDCLVCCVLSHGQEGSVYGVDGEMVQLIELTEPFNGLQCASLMEKPKLFFIQACQGTREQQAVPIQADSPAPCSSICSDAVVPAPGDSIPASADFLMGMATVPDYAAFRDRDLGTWFMQSLCQNLVQMVPSGYDLVSILTKVNDDVSQKSACRGEKKQMPQPAFSLRKRVIFQIPTDPPPHLP
ncbi:caspase-8 [Diretmus argenteus]